MPEHRDAEIIIQYVDRMLVGFQCDLETIAFIHTIPLGGIHEMFLLMALDHMPVADLSKTYHAVKDMKPSLQIKALQQERFYFLKKTFQKYYENSSKSEKPNDSNAFSAEMYVSRKYADRTFEAQEDRIQQMHDEIEEKENEIIRLTEENRSLQRRMNDMAENHTEGKIGSNYSYANMSSNSELDQDGFWYRVKAMILGRRIAVRSKKKDQKEEALRFLNLFVENRNFTEAQKDFLIWCREEGDSIEMIEQWAAPQISVEMMERLREVYYKKR